MGDLKQIPGVGANMERHLKNIGICSVEDLRGKDPEALYELDCLKKGFADDKCVLYVFRCAVYFAEHERHEPKMLKWWYWKDKEYKNRTDDV
ncbi:MAG: Pathogenicity locus [Lachnospiraceae bacterium]|nr:Pathogenicity locus [Lachnospiraceae bacterium]